MRELFGYELATNDVYQNNYYYIINTPYVINPQIYSGEPLGLICTTLKDYDILTERLVVVNL